MIRGAVIVEGDDGGLLVDPATETVGHRPGDGRVEPCSVLSEQRTVCHLLGQGMPEAVFGRVRCCLVEQLGRAQRPEGRLEVRVPEAAHPGDERPGDVDPDDGGGLEHLSCGALDTIDARW